jgi:endonuclease YncB( thermonuclease family)
MTAKMRTRLGLFTLATAAAAWLGTAAPAEAQPVSMVLLNNRATPVFYNDGDTFRPLAGPMRQRSARLGGFNTLESYGRAHQWGGWTFKELYVIAKLGTLNARRGTWSCTADPTNLDGYGRILADCHDLATDQILTGLAHAMSIKGPAKRAYIEIQRKAIVARRGMWAKGVPPMIMTSLHSANERYDNTNNYNRLVSALDGSSLKWYHQNVFDECETVCHPAKMLTKEAAAAVIDALRKDTRSQALVRGMEDIYLGAMLNEYATTDRVAEIFEAKGHEVVAEVLADIKAQGTFGKLRDVRGSCMIHVLFQRRYQGKPDCLKWSR